MLHNREELYKSMDAQGLDFIIGAMWQNVVYLSDFFSPNQSWLYGTVSLVVYPRDARKRPILVLSKSEAELLTTSPGWVTDARFYGDAFISDTGKQDLTASDAQLREYLAAPSFDSPVAAAVDACRSLGVKPGDKVGIDEKGVTAPFIEALAAALGCKLTYAAAVIGQARLIKTPEEVERLRKAVHITEQAIHATMRKARLGMTEREMLNDYWQELLRRGAQPALSCLGFGSHSAHANAQATDEIRLCRNQPVRFDIGCSYQYYQADTAKIAVVGELDEKQNRYFAALRDGIARGVALIKPGATAAQVFQAVMETVCETIPHYRRSHVGHGIGVEIYDPPVISNADWQFRSGMVMCVEAPYYEVGRGGLQVEEVVHITETGVELLSERPVEIIRV